MKDIKIQINIFIFFMLSTLFTISLQAVTFDWQTEGGGWTPGALSKAYTNVAGSGIDMNVTITGSTGELLANFPAADADGLNVRANYSNETNFVTLTMTFSKPVKFSSLKLKDFDTGTYVDRAVILGKDTAGNTVLPSSVTLGSGVLENAPGDYEARPGTNVGPGDASGQVDVRFDDVAVTEVSWTYQNGVTADTNPGTQFLWIDPVVFVESAPTLSIIKTSSANGGPVLPGDTITYEINVTNDVGASGDATQVTISDILPTGVTLSGTPQKTYQTTASTASYTSPVLTVDVDPNVNEPETITFDTTGLLPANSILTSYRLDVIGTANNPSWLSEIDLIATYPTGTAYNLNFGTDLGFGDTAGAYNVTQGPIAVGGTAVGLYEFIWSETFDDAGVNNSVTNATFTINYITRTSTTDNANAPVNMVTAADNITLRPGETLTVTFDVTVDANITTSPLTNTATTNSNEISDISDTAVDTVDLNADLVTVKTVNNVTPQVGDFLTFTITVTNNGPLEATNVSLTDSLPAGLTLTGNTPSQGTYNTGSGLWDIGTLNNAASATLTLTGIVDAGQEGNPITNTTTAATADQSDPTTAGDILSEGINVSSVSMGVSKISTPQNTPPSSC